MKAIGGYFELELSKGAQNYHQTYAFKSGRSALHVIIQQVKAKKVYIPFYTCDALLEPFQVAQVSFKFYAINEALEPVTLPQLRDGEYFLYINYFDLKRKLVQSLSQKYGPQLIVDNSQAFFMKANGESWFFNSCRKFFGVPDGAYLYPPDNVTLAINAERNENFTMQHLICRKIGKIREGYSSFQKNELLCGAEIRQMSVLSEDLLSNVSYEECRQKRIENFQVLHQALNRNNRFRFQFASGGVPMAYPFLPDKAISHQQLWDQNIFIPLLWNDVLTRPEAGFENEKHFADQLLALPVDHRYDVSDMERVINLIQSI